MHVKKTRKDQDATLKCYVAAFWKRKPEGKTCT
jgi:hypothetical protein